MIIVANWKMNKDLQESKLFFNNFESKLSNQATSFFEKIKILIAPSFPFLYHCQFNLSSNKIIIAAQNCSHKSNGAFTGEVSAKMLNSIGVKYVIIGHSERRVYFNEKRDVLKNKIQLCLENNLCPIFCFGETGLDREKGNHLTVIQEQLDIISKQGAGKITLAYEPVWAIGSGKTPSIEQIKEVHSYVKALYDLPILYGGSLNQNNAKIAEK